ncbi:MAG TPA: HAMP domain-containing protein, partial [Kofleriaceae bacterium]|nr:HAMP domain-containing protein [Kofleriaceae bacterium]
MGAASTTNGSPNAKAARKKGGVTLQSRQILAALRAMKRGDFSVRLPDDLDGVDGQICETFNGLVEVARQVGEEAITVRDAIGREGRTKRRMRRGNASGAWGTYVFAVNDMLDDLTQHTDQMAQVVASVSKGDLSHTIYLEGDAAPLKGDFLRHAHIVNGMVDQLSSFGSEVTRVAQEVGVEGKLGAQARIRGVSGTWKELTDSVNLMASNLTSQVREIARVTTAVAQGDLTKSVNIEAKGEILELKNTINTMVDQLGS